MEEPLVLKTSFSLDHGVIKRCNKDTEELRQEVVNHCLEQLGRDLLKRIGQEQHKDYLVKFEGGWTPVKGRGRDDYTARVLLADRHRITTRAVCQNPLIRNCTQQKILELAMDNVVVKSCVEIGKDSGDTWEDTLCMIIKSLLRQNEAYLEELVNYARNTCKATEVNECSKQAT